MRVMVIVKADEASEADAMPGTGLLAGMGRCAGELVRAGVLLAGEGLRPSAQGVRVRFHADAVPEVVSGPFAPVDALVAGFWLLQVRSLDEAIAWAKRVPNPGGRCGEIEIRPVYEPGDAAAASPRAVQAADPTI